jgi:hypothetical protein
MVLAEVPVNMFRRAAYIKNISTAGQIMSIGIGITAVSGSGLVFYPIETWLDTMGAINDKKTNPHENQINVVFSAAGGICAYMDDLIPK